MNDVFEDKTTLNPDDSLIVVKQLPIIEEQLHNIKQQFETETERALSLECSEDTLSIVRKARADLTRAFKFLEEKRKIAKSAVLEPYEAFEEIYKDCVTNVYKPCDDKLAEKIHEVEDRIKDSKRKEAEDFFSEYATAKGIDFVKLEDVGLNITMNASLKSLKKAIQAFLDKVCEELALIDTQPYKSEILVEYKKTLNVAAAITTVNKRRELIEREEERLLAQKAENSAVFDDLPVDEKEYLSAPSVAVATPENEATDKVYEVSFTVRGTMEKIKELKSFLKEGGYEYE